VRYFIDTEFSERGHEHPIELISIGIVAEDGREIYAVAADGWSEDRCNDWVKANVIPQLSDPRPIPTLRATRADVAHLTRCFIDFPRGVGRNQKPEFWSYFGDYDWVVFCQLFGTMMDLPKGWPMYCNDVKQLCVSLGNPELPRQEDGVHNALADARHIRKMYHFLDSIAKERSLR
jgi:hypothetical protein